VSFILCFDPTCDNAVPLLPFYAGVPLVYLTCFPAKERNTGGQAGTHVSYHSQGRLFLDHVYLLCLISSSDTFLLCILPLLYILLSSSPAVCSEYSIKLYCHQHNVQAPRQTIGGQHNVGNRRQWGCYFLYCSQNPNKGHSFQKIHIHIWIIWKIDKFEYIFHTLNKTII
jgi:hypothetical protein